MVLHCSIVTAVKGSGHERTYSFIQVTPTKTINKVNFPHRKEGKGLPKYGSR